MEVNCSNLRAAIDAKMAPLKVAHTRLAHRSQRPNVELTRDPAQYQLVNEVNAIETNIAVSHITSKGDFVKAICISLYDDTMYLIFTYFRLYNPSWAPQKAVSRDSSVTRSTSRKISASKPSPFTLTRICARTSVPPLITLTIKVLPLIGQLMTSWFCLCKTLCGVQVLIAEQIGKVFLRF